jgi:hypothetical protein
MVCSTAWLVSAYRTSDFGGPETGFEEIGARTAVRSTTILRTGIWLVTRGFTNSQP